MTTTSTTGSNTTTQSIHGHQAKIMVVDDDVRLRDLLRRYLTEQGFNVFTAESATAMNKLWLRERYDLLVLDLMLPGEDGLSICRRLRGLTGFQWLGWASLVSLLSLLGAAIISSLINLPLSRLTAAARDIAKGKQPAPLPEKGPIEIIEANRSFNQMVDDLKQVESDRAVILAGISHDLRTPLARMQLEVEMANLSDEAREGIQSDIGQMDAIIGQFLDYAKPTETSSFTDVDLSGLLGDMTREAMRLPDVKINATIADGAHAMGNPTDLRRVLNNLIENARRYGKTPGSDVTEIDIACHVRTSHGAKKVIIEVQDHGTGVPAEKIEQLMKPFTRLDTARGQANGAGLGLAIVDRVLLRHGAELQVRNREGGGLAFQISLPAV